MKRIVGALALISVLGVAKAEALVITFDDRPQSCGTLIGPGNYQGFNWDNIATLSADFCGGDLIGSGYDTGTISEENVAFNWNAELAIAQDGNFLYGGAYYAGAWRDGLELTIEGLLGVNVLFSQTIIVNTNAPTLHAVSWNGINRLRWSSTGGVEDPTLDGSGAHFVMDNLHIDQLAAPPVAAVPEPASLFLAGSGVVFLVNRARRRKR